MRSMAAYSSLHETSSIYSPPRYLARAVLPPQITPIDDAEADVQDEEFAEDKSCDNGTDGTEIEMPMHVGTLTVISLGTITHVLFQSFLVMLKDLSPPR